MNVPGIAVGAETFLLDLDFVIMLGLVIIQAAKKGALSQDDKQLYRALTMGTAAIFGILIVLIMITNGG